MNFENLPTFQYFEDIKQICRPLQEFGVKDFIFMRIFPDGSKANLCSHKDWSHFHFNYYYQGKYNKKVVEQYERNKLDIEFSKFTENGDLLWQSARKNFSIGNCLLLRKNHRLFTEAFVFCADIYNDKINQFYLENIDLFTQFSFFFKEKARDMISESQKKRLPVSDKYKKIYLPEEKFTQNNVDFLIKRFFIEETYITRREHDCLYWLSKGKNAGEVGLILDISKKTVERHIDTVKNKLGIYKTAELLLMACYYGIIPKSNP